MNCVAFFAVFGMHHLNMTAQMATRALNEKLATGRKKAQKMVQENYSPT